LYNIGPLAGYLENRAYETIDARSKLERKQATAERRRGRKDQSLTNKLSYARSAEAKAIALADDVALLALLVTGRHPVGGRPGVRRPP
jgi:hypothetical protein